MSSPCGPPFRAGKITTRNTAAAIDSNSMRTSDTAASPVPRPADCLDQFYTKPAVALDCWRALQPVARKLIGAPASGLYFVEPSAGDGAFYRLLPENRRAGIDIDPKCAGVMKRDFLNCRYRPPVEQSRVVVVGNPPFGKRGRLAVAFINKAFTMADTVAFVVPVIFRKYFIHKQIEFGARLVFSKPLERHAFRTAAKPDYPVNTEFQVWTKLAGGDDKRLFAPPPIAHPDFLMRQYNNTREALKMFERPFDFAVPCQGWQDYTRRETRADDCEKHKQWILFEAHTATVRRRLRDDFDFCRLAMQCTTSVPGFRKGDVVREYTASYE